MTGGGVQCAIYLVRGAELRFVWANETYLAMVPETLRADAIGRRLDEISPLAHLRAEALREVMRTGELQRGEDRIFSVENGTLIMEWSAYRPLDEHVLVVILITPAAAVRTE